VPPQSMLYWPAPERQASGLTCAFASCLACVTKEAGAGVVASRCRSSQRRSQRRNEVQRKEGGKKHTGLLQAWVISGGFFVCGGGVGGAGWGRGPRRGVFFFTLILRIALILIQ
jgi:hypothetical protein